MCPLQRTFSSGLMPASKIANAVTTFQVDPGGYVLPINLFMRGECLLSTIDCQILSSKFVANMFESKHGIEHAANNLPVVSSMTAAQPFLSISFEYTNCCNSALIVSATSSPGMPLSVDKVRTIILLAFTSTFLLPKLPISMGFKSFSTPVFPILVSILRFSYINPFLLAWAIRDSP